MEVISVIKHFALQQFSCLFLVTFFIFSISVDYKQDGDFVVLEEAVSEEGELDETWEPIVSMSSR